MAEHTPAPTPERGIYGFSFYLLFSTMFIIYVFWTYVPLSILEDTLGLTYLPDKYFAVFVPILVLVCVTHFAFFIYPSLGLIMTLDIDDPRTIHDKFSIRRCQYKENLCENKLDDDNIFCLEHQVGEKDSDHNSRPVGRNPIQTQLKGNQISHFCDCRQHSECLLRSDSSLISATQSTNDQEDYFNLLRKRKKVPSVIDLNISDVCKKLYPIDD